MAILHTLTKQYECDRKVCGHKWTPRKNKVPVVCPKCHSPYWNRKDK